MWCLYERYNFAILNYKPHSGDRKAARHARERQVLKPKKALDAYSIDFFLA